jgi:hypothetical protein
MLESGEFA